MTEQDPADRAYNKIISNNAAITYAELRDGKIIELNPLGSCYGGQVFPINNKMAPMDVNVVSAWLDGDKKALWRRPPKPSQAQPKSGPPAPPPPPASKKSTAPPPPPASKKSTPTVANPKLAKMISQFNRKNGMPEDHIIYTKITEGKATIEDFNQLIQESTPESVRDRVRRRMKTNATDSHQDDDGHQQLDLPDLNKRVQPKRKPAGRAQMNGRGRVAHRHSARTQEKTMPKQFAEAVEFIKKYIGQSDYHDALQLVEDKRTLNLVATKFMSAPHVNREWLFELITKCSK